MTAKASSLNYLCAMPEPWLMSPAEIEYSRKLGVRVYLNGAPLTQVFRCDVERGYVDVYVKDQHGNNLALGFGCMRRSHINRLFGKVEISMM